MLENGGKETNKKILSFAFYACFVYLIMKNLTLLRQIVVVGSVQLRFKILIYFLPDIFSAAKHSRGFFFFFPFFPLFSHDDLWLKSGFGA